MNDQSPPPIHEQAAWLAEENERLRAEVVRLRRRVRELKAQLPPPSRRGLGPEDWRNLHEGDAT